jgi:hypothetical protein
MGFLLSIGGILVRSEDRQQVLPGVPTGTFRRFFR